MIVANSFWNLQLTIDRVFLGHYSTESLGAAMAVMGVFWVPMALLQQTAAYLMTFVAQYFGANQKDKIGSAVWQALYFCLAGGVLFLALMPMASFIFTNIGHSPSLQKLEIEYFVSLCFSALPTALVAVVGGLFSGLGITTTIMWVNCVGLVANVIFDYVLIFGNFGFPAMGIAGAGYATAIANWIAAIYGMYLIFHPRNEVEYKVRSSWRFNVDLMKRLIKFGMPSGLQWALEGLAFTVFLIFIGRMENGSAALSASGIAVTIMMLAILPALGMGQAVSMLVGQHLGAKKPELAEASAWSGVQVAAMYIFAMGISFVAAPGFYLGWFENSKDPLLWSEVSSITTYLLMYVALFTAFDSMNLVFSFALKGAGDTRYVTLVALLLPWPIMVFPTWLAKDLNGAIFWAWGAASLFIITQALVFWRRFVGGKWKLMSVIN